MVTVQDSWKREWERAPTLLMSMVIVYVLSYVRTACTCVHVFFMITKVHKVKAMMITGKAKQDKNIFFHVVKNKI